jgi:hypothetical protein
VTPCVESSVKSSPSIYHQKYESNNENFIPSHIKNDDAQSDAPEFKPEKEEKFISPSLNSNTSNTIATQTYSNPEDDSDEDDIKPSVTILNRKQKPDAVNDLSKDDDEATLSKSTIQTTNLPSVKCDVSSRSSKCVEFNAKPEAPIHCIKSTDFNGNDEKTKTSYMEQKEKLEKNLLDQTLKFCSRKHSKKHQKRKKKLLNSKIAIGLKLTANDGINVANTENGTACLGKSFQHPVKLNKSFATLTVVHPAQQSVSSQSQQHGPLHVTPFPIKAVTTVANNNFKLLPQQPISMANSTSVFPITTPSSKAITGLSFPATAVTAGGATIHPISAVSSNNCNKSSKLPSKLSHTDAVRQTSCASTGKFKKFRLLFELHYLRTIVFM